MSLFLNMTGGEHCTIAGTLDYMVRRREELPHIGWWILSPSGSVLQRC